MALAHDLVHGDEDHAAADTAFPDVGASVILNGGALYLVIGSMSVFLSSGWCGSVDAVLIGA